VESLQLSGRSGRSGDRDGNSYREAQNREGEGAELRAWSGRSGRLGRSGEGHRNKATVQESSALTLTLALIGAVSALCRH